ncbi:MULTISPECIES: TetR/AcrR family transcriptional regulator [unclassified Rathayibacter]|uniref:TetR/AcrR family transcriptional regulator n=1 Tax=unclassified Rathayibacter TaxID=2609250 RepID=UPI000CE82B22|nr:MULTISPECIES: TetR/AcrR family transcriptional regulator [unclassified Rathayibacter]PPF43277.1 TetR family transcriptional regulator [Rathayibacter sp. AY1A1]PPH02987.1 TetR family transcriptional regulator [Rathayibacter sp. AY1G9]
MPSPSSRSTAEAQRERITAAALHVFARTGYAATPITEVAAEAGVSPAYVFRLFPGKLGVFVAAVDRCYEQVASTLAAAGEASPSSDPADRLEVMTVAYIDLIADRDLIMLQSQAQSACDVPEIREAVRRGISAVVRTVTVVSGADGPAVQRFVAYGQLCHLIVQTDLGGVDSEWARIVSDGIRHRD